jgi:uncharacterized protein (TIGR03435 family)
MIFPAIWNEAWTAALGNHLWQSTAVTGVAWLLVRSLRNNHARTRYWLWMVASVKFLIPFSLLIAAGESLRSAFAAPFQKPALAAAMEQVVLPFPQAASPASVAYGGVAPAAAIHPGNILPSILLVVWLCGFLLVLFSWMRGWLRIRASIRASSRMMLQAEVPVLSSPLLIEPGIFGIFRPVLLLPQGINDRLSSAQLGTIIAHEMCHVRRRDNLTAASHMIVEALFWFHPAVWWIETRLLEEREQACDEAVLQSGSEADLYAESILNVCKFCIESPLACVAGVAGSDLKRRIVRIMAEKMARNLDLGRKLLLALAATVAISIPVFFGLVQIKLTDAQASTGNPARELAGTWQGTLHSGLDLRGVLKVSKTEGGGYNAVFYAIDQAASSIPVTKIVLDGMTVRFSVADYDGVFEGRLNSDGTSITGNWSQYSFTHPLTLKRATPETAWEIPKPQPPMAVDADPSFATAAIQPSKPDAPSKALTTQMGRMAASNLTLSDLISLAYEVNPKQIIEAPAWLDTEKLDINAQYREAGVPDDHQLRGMVRKLLAGRFHLSLHRETRELAVYALSTAGNGPRLTRNAAGPNQAPDLLLQAPGKLKVGNGSMRDLVRVMQFGVLDRPVLDRTGIEGRYDFTLNWTPDSSQFPGLGMKISHPADGIHAPPPLSAAIQQQIGLKLEAIRAPVEVLVIDHVEKPSAEN